MHTRLNSVLFVVFIGIAVASLMLVLPFVNAKGLRGNPERDLFGIRPNGVTTDTRMKEFAKAAQERAKELAKIPLIEPDDADTTRWMED